MANKLILSYAHPLLLFVAASLVNVPAGWPTASSGDVFRGVRRSAAVVIATTGLAGIVITSLAGEQRHELSRGLGGSGNGWESSESYLLNLRALSH